ncbi:ESPR-type extended signal peptide-containing protein [Escherichia coli]
MKRHLNTSYRLVWNHITGTLVVASELARSRGKRAGVAVALSLAAVTSVPALAADTVVQAGETVSGGTLTNHDNQIVFGTVNGMTISTGLEYGPDNEANTGGQWVQDGGTANKTTVTSGGLQRVNPGGSVSDTVISAGGGQSLQGRAVNTTLNGGEQWMHEGAIPGVTDPAEASRLIRRGHLTYTQARNITRFGTIESVTYDIAEGSVVSLAAGGISFALTASVFWLSTGERDAALQTAAVQAGKTFTRTLAVYVTTQQLHRLSVVQGMLKHIDFSTASPTVRLALQKGTGAGNISALNKVMKGTLVTSLALVAVTTGPDMIKMLRGRISGTQFIRNLAVASSGVAGGAVGSVAGGILFSPLGPFGALTGRVVGGVLGGMIASAVSGKIAGALVEEDRVKILAMIQEQVTWLAGSFLLTGHEIENLNANLARVIDQNALEIIFAAGIQQRAATNMLIKPLVVSIIRQRPVMEYDASHLGNMVNRLEEALPPELPA